MTMSMAQNGFPCLEDGLSAARPIIAPGFVEATPATKLHASTVDQGPVSLGTGKMTRNVLPLPSSLSTSIFPLWASTIIFDW